MTVRPSQGARPTSPMQFRPYTTQQTYTTPDPQYTGGNPLNASILSSNVAGSFAVHQTNPPRTASNLNASRRSQPIASSGHGSPQAQQMTTTTGKGASPNHASLLIEPILLPNMQHVHVDSQQDLEESCLFYPTGHKNKNIRREIENSVVKHHIIENSRMIASRKRKEVYRIIRPDPYANAKGPPLVYTKKKDDVVENIIGKMHNTRGKMDGLVQIRL